MSPMFRICSTTPAKWVRQPFLSPQTKSDQWSRWQSRITAPPLSDQQAVGVKGLGHRTRCLTLSFGVPRRDFLGGCVTAPDRRTQASGPSGGGNMFLSLTFLF
jgi:hypothetical protein